MRICCLLTKSENLFNQFLFDIKPFSPGKNEEHDFKDSNNATNFKHR